MDERGAIPIDVLHLALSAAFVVAAGVLSLALRLGLEKKLLVASLRTVVQLLLVGRGYRPHTRKDPANLPVERYP